MPTLKEELPAEKALPAEVSKDILASMTAEDAIALVASSKAEWEALVDENVVKSATAVVDEKPAVVVDHRLREDVHIKLSTFDATFLVEQYKLQCHAHKDAIWYATLVEWLEAEKRLPIDGIPVEDEPELVQARKDLADAEQAIRVAMAAQGAKCASALRAAGVEGVVAGGYRHNIAEGSITALKAREGQ